LPTSNLAKHGWKILFIAIGGFYLFGLGALPFVGPDEPRYAQVAREMFLRRDLITPTLGGRPWFEKPPLLYWLMMASYRLFGVTEYAARLGPALCGLLTAAFLYWFARNVEAEISGQTELGRWSALVLLSSFGAIAFSRAASFDIVLTMTLTGALCCFFVAHLRIKTEAKGAPWLLLGFYVLVGLSLLAKGLIGLVLPFGVIASYLWVRREWPHQRLFKSLLWGIPVLLLVAATWYGPMIQRHGWTFINQFIVQHHFARFLSNKYHHPQPIYFYVPVLLLMVLPWTVVLISALIGSRRWQLRADDPLGRARLFAGMWIVVPLVFFSLSQSKIPGYILPVLPAAAFLIGERISFLVSAERGERVIRLTAVWLIVGSAVGAWYAIGTLHVPMGLVVTAGIIVAVVSVAALLTPRYRTVLFVVFGLIPFAVSLLAVKPAAMVANGESVRDLIQMADARGYADKPLFYFLADDRTAEFYAGGRLAYESNAEPARFEGAQDVAAAIREKGGMGLVLVETRWESQLTNYTRVRAEKIGNNDWYSLFVVRTQ
jgi:4-amino-4-deoxy-L-arabinose transferase-like glycosyltransferase